MIRFGMVWWESSSWPGMVTACGIIVPGHGRELWPGMVTASSMV